MDGSMETDRGLKVQYRFHSVVAERLTSGCGPEPAGGCAQPLPLMALGREGCLVSGHVVE